MSRKKTGAFLRIGVFLMVALLMVTSSVRPVGALTEQEYNLYWQNSIFFYNPYECLGDYAGGDEENEGGGGEQQLAKIEWDGNCSNVSSYDARIRQYRDAVKQVADQNGLPWEGIMAQMILESGFMSHEACSYNPLGLKGQPSCDGQHRSFNSYEEAFNYYVNSIKSVRLAIQKGTFANDPYGYIDFLINGVPYGSQYTTEPTYVTLASAIVCGLQKWADANGYPISGDGSPNPSNPLNPSSPSDSSTSSSGSDDGYTSPNCPGSKKEEPGGGSWDDNDDDEEEKDYDPDDYVFPLQGATKSNYLFPSALSPMPCTNLARGGCHHDYYALDLGLKTGTKTVNDFPDLKGTAVDRDDLWQSVGVKVVAMTSGTITSYTTYSRATMGYQSKCASVNYETDDGRAFWLGHMSYDSRYKAGDTFSTGDVIGEVGPPPCAIGTQAHLHVDETLKYGSGGTVETIKLLNALYEKLP